MIAAPMMNGFNPMMLALAGAAALLFAVVFILLIRRTSVASSIKQAEAPAVPSPSSTDSPAGRPAYQPWRLMTRVLANPGSASGPLHRLRLEPEGPLPNWRPGAMARIYCGPAGDVMTPGIQGLLPTGDYLIASLPADGAIDLAVRLRPGDGLSQGLRSRWLCHDLDTGQRVALALIDDPDFAPPPDEAPMIMIGNGTGIAALQAHIKARPPGTRNWLVFGDRNSVDDTMLAAEIADWMASGHLERCDLVYPGDGPVKRRIVDQLEDSQAPLLDWTLADGVIYVCGNRQLGEDVDAVLTAILGADVLDALSAEGRYRRSLF